MVESGGILRVHTFKQLGGLGGCLKACCGKRKVVCWALLKMAKLSPVSQRRFLSGFSRPLPKPGKLAPLIRSLFRLLAPTQGAPWHSRHRPVARSRTKPNGRGLAGRSGDLRKQVPPKAGYYFWGSTKSRFGRSRKKSPKITKKMSETIFPSQTGPNRQLFPGPTHYLGSHEAPGLFFVSALNITPPLIFLPTLRILGKTKLRHLAI